MITGNEGKKLICNVEGLRLIGYLCPANIPTIGYGHTGLVDGNKIVVGKTTITPQKAMDLLTSDLKKYENYVNGMVKVTLTQNQFDALVSFVYNNGAGGLLQLVQSSGLNQGHYGDVPIHLIQYDKATIKGKLTELPGLKARRLREIVLWNKR